MQDSLAPKYCCNVNFTLKRAYLCLPKDSCGRLEGSGAAMGSTLMMGDCRIGAFGHEHRGGERAEEGKFGIGPKPTGQETRRHSINLSCRKDLFCKSPHS